MTVMSAESNWSMLKKPNFLKPLSLAGCNSYNVYSRLKTESVVINYFCAKRGAGEGADQLFTQLAAFTLYREFLPPSFSSSRRQIPCI